MNIVAIIPARGGSKRIPGKNVRPFCGKPLIAYSIDAAKESGLFDRIIVSTDSDDIARVALDCGAEVPFRRPAELSGDCTATDPVIQNALGWLQAQQAPADFFCCIYATAPFISADDLRRGFNLLQEHRATSAFAVTSYPYTIFRSLKITAAGRVEMFWPENLLKRSQDLPEAYHDAGQFYWGDTAKYLQEGRIFSADAVPVVIPRHRVQDIDTQEDWDRAELMFKAYRDGR